MISNTASRTIRRVSTMPMLHAAGSIAVTVVNFGVLLVPPKRPPIMTRRRTFSTFQERVGTYTFDTEAAKDAFVTKVLRTPFGSFEDEFKSDCLSMCQTTYFAYTIKGPASSVVFNICSMTFLEARFKATIISQTRPEGVVENRSFIRSILCN